jgi:hypothetical protein
MKLEGYFRVCLVPVPSVAKVQSKCSTVEMVADMMADVIHFLFLAYFLDPFLLIS